MKFFVVDHVPASVANTGPIAFLVRDRWNDWFKWVTQFTALVLSPEGMQHLGSIKIGQRGMDESDGTVRIPEQFDILDESYFALGQDENFYETANALPEKLKTEFLIGVRDCAFNLDIFDSFENEPVMLNSLLRDVNSFRVRNKMHALSQGRAVLTPYNFEYEFPEDNQSLDPPPKISVSVTPNAFPPTNIHVLIGRNGVGKSRCFNLIAQNFISQESQGDANPSLGKIRSTNENIHSIFGVEAVQSGDVASLFSGIVFVAFSAFDAGGPASPPKEQRRYRYSYVGLKQGLRESNSDPLKEKELEAPLKSIDELSQEFVASVEVCRQGARLRRWRNALNILESDPLFKETLVSDIANYTQVDWRTSAKRLFGNLSSGHGIVLLTITKLVELVEERSLVLIDEPEGHLHPPLLSAFVRALSDLLIDRNGVALVATHSPVVLQEVPRSCVWILSRTGHSARADRPEIETFGENAGILTREVFGLEVAQSGFHRMIQEAVDELGNYEAVQRKFDGQLGAEARSLARAMSLLTNNKFAS